MSEQPNKFFVGRIFDALQGKVTDQNVYYDPADLTTHGIVTGMTGSGKTGLCIALLEEAALQKIPAIIIDPKGDLTNLLLHFPELRPEDFQPYLDPELARRDNKDLPTLAKETAENWKTGLAQWGLGKDNLTALSNAAKFTIYTPGSTAGKSISILSSFEKPAVSWEDNQEILREKISTVVTAVLSLVGMTDIDPLRSREHILLSNIIENAWAHDQSLNMTDLIVQTQTPPFERLGAFPVDNMFPPKDRMELAMLLNNFLASPSFQSWLEGDPLDIGAMLYTADGKPRHNIFYIAHLNDSERMFFVTLLFAAVESWMRSQRGSAALRALVYFDEIMGYLPPTARPPSHMIMLRMLKQARAFGVGLLLATQNPVDVDYKALSNAGTWFIGRLQTDQDKQRLLDGLSSASGNVDRSTFDTMISGLKKRVFLMHNVRNAAPVLMSSRWALNYLAGPMTREQVRTLTDSMESQVTQATATSAGTTIPTKPNAATGGSLSSMGAQTMGVKPAQTAAAKPNGSTYASAAVTLTSTKPAVPATLPEYFVPLAAGQKPAGQVKSIVYRPALLAQSETRYINRTYNLDTVQKVAALVTDVEGAYVNWDGCAWNTFQTRDLQGPAIPQSSYAQLPGWLMDPKRISMMQKDYEEWVFRNSSLRLRTNKELGVTVGPEVTTAQLRDMCSQAAKKLMEADINKIENTYKTKLTAMQRKVNSQEMDVKKSENEVSQRTVEEVGAGGQFLLSLLGGRKRGISTNLTKRRLTAQAKADLEREKQQLEDMEKDLTELTKQQQDDLNQIQDQWAEKVNNITEIAVTAQKSNIFTDVYGVAWMPYYLMADNQEVPAFQPPQK